ncbi:MAG: hypothetical protein ACRDZ4_15940 [Egibacteraceae bacterium]
MDRKKRTEGRRLHCPRCDVPTEQLVACTVCSKVGCIETCQPAGKNSACASCGGSRDESDLEEDRLGIEGEEE